MVVAVPADGADRAIDVCRATGHQAVIVGRVDRGSGVEFEGELRFPDWV